MSNILEQIIQTKHEELAVRKAQCSLEAQASIGKKTWRDCGDQESLTKQRRDQRKF